MEDYTKNSTLEFDIRIKLFDKTKGELVDVFAAGSKLTKADAGKNSDISNKTIDENTSITITPVCRENESNICIPQITISTNAKLTKADAGKLITNNPK
jgi:hypothetical protein